MKFKISLAFLGNQTKKSKKGTEYMLPKFMDTDTSNVYEFYLPADKIGLITKIAKLENFEIVPVILELTSFNNKAEVTLADLGKKEG